MSSLSSINKLLERKWIKNELKDLTFIGEGSFGAVYSCIYKDPTVRKALKVINFKGEKDDLETWFKASKREIDNLQTLKKCKQIMKLDYHYNDYENSSIYLITELGRANLLKRLSDFHYNLPHSEINNLITSVLLGIKYAHERGIFHRDIKPDNILLSYEGHYIICDWGIAGRSVNLNTGTQSITAVGTRDYLSPEIRKTLVDGIIVESNFFKADMYSAGLTFLVACGLRQNELESLNKWNKEEHDQKIEKFIIQNISPKVPEFAELILNLTEFDHNDRFAADQALEWCYKNKILAIPTEAYGNIEETVMVTNLFKRIFG